MDHRTSVLGIAVVLLLTWREAGSLESNIDSRVPVLRLSPGQLNDSHHDQYGDDLFGFAFAFHEMEQIVPASDGTQEAARKTRLIVGAPRGSYPGGLPLDDPGMPAETRTGLVYDCPIVSDGGGLCGPVLGEDQTDTTINTLTITVDDDFLTAGSRLFDHRPDANTLSTFGTPLRAERKSGQFLGATVFSRNGILLVCAPIWVVSGEYNSTIGREGNAPANNNSIPLGRCYSTNRQLQSVTFLDPCNVMNEVDVRVDEGYCTTGTDVDMMEDGRFVIGSTGYDLGVGTLFYGGTQNEMLMRNNSMFGRGNTRHTTASVGKQNILEVSQGYQVTTGFITRMKPEKDTTSSPPNSLASVPRFDGTAYFGKIDIYDARRSGGSIEQLLVTSAEGTQIGEFFGYAMDTVDINGDLYDDLVVGAPMYSKIEIMSEVQVETGRVYVFINNGGTLSTTPIVFEGTVVRARLGMSVLGLGDLDQDGFEDFAVGSPYEPDGDSIGVVYIYHGSDDLTLFRQQTPFRVSSRATADRLRDVSSLQQFGWALGSFDFDNNGYNDLAVGAPYSAAVVLFRSRPVVRVGVSVRPSVSAVIRSDTSCRVASANYSCFFLTVNLNFSGKSLPDEIGVKFSVREVRLNEEARIFFGNDVTQNQIVMSASLDPVDTVTTLVYLLNFITDSESPLQLELEVLPNVISQPTSPGDGLPPINDISNDFLIRQPTGISLQVNLTNDCGGDDMCQTDFSLSTNGVSYLPDRGLNYRTIEMGGVKTVRVGLTLANMGEESAIVLLLGVQHSVSGIFTDIIQIEIDDRVLNCIPSVEPCNVNEIFKGQSEDIVVILEVEPDAPIGDFVTNFTLFSSVTTDTVAGNNDAIIDFTVDRRADLKISLIFPQEQVMYKNTPLEKMPAMRSDVGALVSMEVRVSNVHSSNVDTAIVDVFYPASAEETGDNFYLLPDCGVTASVTEEGTGTIRCEDTHLIDISSLGCGSARRKRHSVSPSVKQRWRRSAESGSWGLRRRPRAATSLLDCSATPEACLKVRCTISQLKGLSGNEAKISVRGYVDERFFFDKNMMYELRAMANVTFVAEDTIDVGAQPDSATATVTISPPISTSSGRSENRLTLIFVILAVIIGPIIIITIITIILWRCGFFKRKRHGKEGDDEEEVIPPPPADAKPEGTTL